jgi:hypothetical protein
MRLIPFRLDFVASHLSAEYRSVGISTEYSRSLQLGEKFIRQFPVNADDHGEPLRIYLLSVEQKRASGLGLIHDDHHFEPKSSSAD